FYRAGHIGGDNTRPNFIHVDAVVGEACCIKWREHREGRFGDAIIAAISRSGVGADLGDRDDFPAFFAFWLLEHPPGGKLRQEVWAFEVDVDEAIETGFSGVKDVRPNLWRDTGVVDEQVQASEGRARKFDEARPLLALTNVRLANFGAHGPVRG